MSTPPFFPDHTLRCSDHVKNARNAFHFIMYSLVFFKFLLEFKKNLTFFCQKPFPQYYSRKVIDRARGNQQSTRNESPPTGRRKSLPIAGARRFRRTVFIHKNYFLHQLLVQYIEFFKFSRFFEIFLNVLATTAISFIFILMYALAFRIKQKV